ncbi:MAG: hypothetical protein ACJ8AI_13810 [Rhodopila sp.]
MQVEARDRHLPAAVRDCQQRGYAAWEAGRPAESLDWFRRAVDAEPSCRPARAALAFMLAISGDLAGSFRETATIMLGIDPHPLTWAGQRLTRNETLLMARPFRGPVVRWSAPCR